MNQNGEKEFLLKRLQAKWAKVLGAYPELGREFGREPWDAEGRMNPKAFNAYKEARSRRARGILSGPSPAPAHTISGREFLTSLVPSLDPSKTSRGFRGGRDVRRKFWEERGLAGGGLEKFVTGLAAQQLVDVGKMATDPSFERFRSLIWPSRYGSPEAQAGMEKFALEEKRPPGPLEKLQIRKDVTPLPKYVRGGLELATLAAVPATGGLQRKLLAGTRGGLTAGPVRRAIAGALSGPAAMEYGAEVGLKKAAGVAARAAGPVVRRVRGRPPAEAVPTTPATRPANLTPSFGRELGRGVYFSTDRQIAQGFAEGRAPFLVGTARTRKGTEVVSRFVIPKDTKIFTRDKVLDIDLLEQLQQRPTFARHWADEWSLQPASRDNIWAAAEETRMLPELQSLLESQGFKGARHTQGPGQFDYAIWDSSIIKKEGTGLQLFRGAAPATRPADVTPTTPEAAAPASGVFSSRQFQLPGAELARDIMQSAAKIQREMPAAREELRRIEARILEGERDAWLRTLRGAREQASMPAGQQANPLLMLEPRLVAGRWVVDVGYTDIPAGNLLKYGFRIADDIPQPPVPNLAYVDAPALPEIGVPALTTPTRAGAGPTRPVEVPTGPARAARIGDDVVFEGADGTTGAGKVIGKGTIEINEVSKPYFTIKTATEEVVQRPIEAVRLRAADVTPTTPVTRGAEAAKGKLDSLFLPGESGLSVNEVFTRAKEQGLVKTKKDFQNLLRKELNEQLIDSGTGATGMKPTLKGLVPLELSPIGSLRRLQFREIVAARAAPTGPATRAGVAPAARAGAPARTIDDVVTGITENVGGTKASVPSVQRNVRDRFNTLLADTGLNPRQLTTARKYISKYTDLDDAGIDDVLARARVGEVPAPTGPATRVDLEGMPRSTGWIEPGVRAAPAVTEREALFQTIRARKEASAAAARAGVPPAAPPGIPGVTFTAPTPVGAIPTGARTARQEIEDIISRVPETSINIKPKGKRSAAAIVRRNFDELLAGGEVKGRAARVSYIARQTGRSKEEINGLIGRGPTEPPAVGVGDNFTNDSVEELRATHIDHRDWVRGVGELLAGLPGVNTLRQSVMKRVFTPASVARMTGNEAVAEGHLYRLGQEQQQAAASARLLGFGTTKTEGMWARPTRLFDVLTEGPEKGKLLLADGSRKAFGDVAENPAAHRAKGLITTEQEKWITDAHEYLDELARNYQLVSGKQLIFKKGRQHYWPRFVVKEDGKIGVSSERVFARQSPGAPRIHETVQEGMDANVKYMEDPLAQLTAYSRAVSKMTRDSIFEKRLLSKNIILPDGTPQAMAVRRAPGAKITGLPEWQQRRAWGELDISEAAKQQLAQPMGLRRGGFLRGAEMVAAVPKMIVTGLFDTGQFFIQGMPLLAYRPNRWAKATAGALRTLFSRSPEDYFNHWMRTGYADKIKDAAAHGMDVSALSEYYQAQGLLARVPVVGVLGSRFGAAFHAYMNVGRVEMYNAMATMARSRAARSGQSAAELEGELRRIARIADTIMGGTSTKGLGLSATQRQVENAVLFFAPRYTRSVFGTVAHAAGSGAGAAETQKVLAQMLFGAAAIVAGAVGAIGVAKGKSKGAIAKDIERALDPRSGAAFMSAQFGDQYYGVGGGYRALARLVANVTPGIPGREGRPSAWGRVMEDAARGKYGDVAVRNPIVMFWRSKAAIPTGTLADAIDGEDFIGEDFTLNAFTEDPGRFGRAVMKRTTPFPVQAFVEVLASGSGVAPAVAAGAAEFVGGRQVPVSLVQRREEIGMAGLEELGIGGTVDEIIESEGYGGGSYFKEELTEKERKGSLTATWQQPPGIRLKMLEDPAFVAATLKAREGVRDPGLKDYYEKDDSLFDSLIQRLNGAWKAAEREWPENPNRARREYRLRRQKIFTEYYALKQHIRGEAEEAGIFRDFDPEGPFGKANDIINRVLFTDDEDFIKEWTDSYVPLEDDLGRFNWDERTRRMDRLIDKFSKKYVDDATALARAKLPEFEQRRRNDVDAIAETGYWDVETTAAAELKMTKTWDAYKKLTMEKAFERDKDEDIRRIKRRAEEKKLLLRRNNRHPGGLEELLIRWGYVTKGIISRMGPAFFQTPPGPRPPPVQKMPRL